MDHNDIRHKLSEYIDGSVTPDEKTAIEGHLPTCTECADAVSELRKTIEHIHSVEEVQPPAWMTQKIMSKVREEQEAKQRFWHRLFYPLAVKLPIQAVAVLFLTVTVYYIYSGMHPAEKYVEAPIRRLAQEEARPAAPGVPQKTEPELAAPQKKRAEQAPGYRSLDMKYEYERPAPPAPMEAPAAAVPAERAAPMTAKQAAPAAGAATSHEAADRATEPAGRISAVQSPEREAEAQLAVTEHFTKFDLPEQMKVKGLTFSTRRFRPESADLQWMLTMTAFRSSTCGDKYVVDVDLSGRSSKYLYCYDKGLVRLLGGFELRNGTWTEIK